MTGFFAVPLQPNPQTMVISLGGTAYQLTLNYQNTEMGGWTLDIADASGKPILSGLPLVTGHDMLEQYGYLNFGGELWVQTTSDPDAVPTFENLGSDGMLYWVTP